MKRVREDGSAIGSRPLGLFSVNFTTRPICNGRDSKPLRRNAYPDTSFLSTQEIVDNPYL